MDDFSMGVLEACFYFRQLVKELVRDEKTRMALLERVDALVERVARRCAETLLARL